MFYQPEKRDHGLPYDPMKALVAPRPIGWISSLSTDGAVNLAPYSFFNLIAAPPPLVAFGSYTVKDSQSNIEATGEFVCNLASGALAEAVNTSSKAVAPGVDEFDLAGLEKLPSTLVKPPRVAASPAHLECVYLKTVPLEDRSGERAAYSLIVGEVIGVHIDDAYITEAGLVDTRAMNPLTRMGYMDYGLLSDVFTMPRP